MPAPRITTDFPAPILGGQSPGRGDIEGCDGGGIVGRAGGDAADDEPHAETAVPIPIASIVRNMAEPPTALPTAVRNSRRAIPDFLLIYVAATAGVRLMRQHNADEIPTNTVFSQHLWRQ